MVVREIPVRLTEKRNHIKSQMLVDLGADRATDPISAIHHHLTFDRTALNVLFGVFDIGFENLRFFQFTRPAFEITRFNDFPDLLDLLAKDRHMTQANLESVKFREVMAPGYLYPAIHVHIME